MAAARLPPGVLQHLTTHSSTYWSIYQQVLAVQITLQKRLVSPVYNGFVAPLLGRLIASPDIASVILVLIILIVSLQMLNLAFRAVMFWIRLAVRLVFWGSVVGLAVWFYQRGFDGVADDLGVVQNTWQREYRYWNQQAAAARRARAYG